VGGEALAGTGFKKSGVENEILVRTGSQNSGVEDEICWGEGIIARGRVVDVETYHMQA